MSSPCLLVTGQKTTAQPPGLALLVPPPHFFKPPGPTSTPSPPAWESLSGSYSPHPHAPPAFPRVDGVRALG